MNSVKTIENNIALTPEDTKCGFGLVSEVQLNFDEFSEDQQRELTKLLQRPTKQTSIVSPSGIFRIHYDVTGFEVPNYDPLLTTEENVMQVAIALDSSYNFEVGFLGYPAPPEDNGAGGDNLYDIYITSARGNYGLTYREEHLGSEKYSSFIEIHYDFANFFTTGLAAMKVTVAHELHHAIQIGNYIFRFEDAYFYEITSTAMEEFVYDDVNDYYFYIRNYTNYPARKFTRFLDGTFDGYDLAIWNIFIEKNFTHNLLKNQWELMPTQRAINAISNTLIFAGTSFAREYNRFGIWLFFTGFRSIPGLYFNEAENYPMINPLATISYPQFTYSEVNAQATSNNYIKFNISSNQDTLVAVVTNGDVNSAMTEQLSDFDFRYTLYPNSINGERKLSENYSADFSASNLTVWSVSEILNDVVVLEDSVKHPSSGSINYPYPNPFNYKSYLLSTPLIFFPTSMQLGEETDINIYSSGMQLIYSSKKSVQNLPGSQRGIAWDGMDSDGNKLASGVYIYVIKNGDEIIKGKVVIFNE